MQIRTFKQSDAEKVRDLINDIFREEYELEKDAFSDEDLLPEFYKGQKDNILIAEEESKIIGAVSIKEESPDTALIKWLAIHRDYRGRNFGQQLLHRAIDFSRIKGFKNINFRSTSRMKAAINLCLKNRFEIVSEKDMGKIRIVKLSLKTES